MSLNKYGIEVLSWTVRFFDRPGISPPLFYLILISVVQSLSSNRPCPRPYISRIHVDLSINARSSSARENLENLVQRIMWRLW